MSDYFKTSPNQAGEFGEFGGSFVPPHLQEEMDKPRQSILVNLSGRGDKDIDFVVEQYGLPE